MYLPLDVWKMILSYCGGSAARDVCKRWRALIPKSKLILSQFHCDIKTAQWCINNGCPSTKVSVWAADNVHLHVLKWLSIYRYELSPEVLTRVEIGAGIKTKTREASDILNWLYDSGHIYCIEYDGEAVFFWTSIERED